MKTGKALLTGLALAVIAMSVPASAHAGDRDRGHDRDRHDRYNSNCRDYSRTVEDNGFLRTAYGTACLGRDGAWRIVSENVARHYAPEPVIQVRETYPAYRYHSDYRGRRYDRYDRYDRHDNHRYDRYSNHDRRHDGRYDHR